MNSTSVFFPPFFRIESGERRSLLPSPLSSVYTHLTLTRPPPSPPKEKCSWLFFSQKPFVQRTTPSPFWATTSFFLKREENFPPSPLTNNNSPLRHEVRLEAFSDRKTSFSHNMESHITVFFFPPTPVVPPFPFFNNYNGKTI